MFELPVIQPDEKLLITKSLGAPRRSGRDSDGKFDAACDNRDDLRAEEDQDISDVDFCRECGECCRHSGAPPFAPGEELWDHLPDDLRQDAIAARSRRNFDIPCAWFDQSTNQCRHYEFRPVACREFQVHSPICLSTRAMADIDSCDVAPEND